MVVHFAVSFEATQGKNGEIYQSITMIRAKNITTEQLLAIKSEMWSSPIFSRLVNIRLNICCTDAINVGTVCLQMFSLLTKDQSDLGILIISANADILIILFESSSSFRGIFDVTSMAAPGVNIKMKRRVFVVGVGMTKVSF